MKRILQFNKTDTGYACYENDENVFEVSKNDLQFDIKAFYQALYSENKDFEDIEVENCISDDKVGGHVYKCIVTLIKKINEKMMELTLEEKVENDEN